jgi:hypothetical protein
MPERILHQCEITGTCPTSYRMTADQCRKFASTDEDVIGEQVPEALCPVQLGRWLTRAEQGVSGDEAGTRVLDLTATFGAIERGEV